MNRLGGKELGLKRVQVGADVPASASAAPVAAAAAAPATTTIRTRSGRAVSLSVFISQFDEAARRRLNSMNEKLRRLELQMEALEAEINRATDSSGWS